jgi:hypothetical protein
MKTVHELKTFSLLKFLPGSQCAFPSILEKMLCTTLCESAVKCLAHLVHENREIGKAADRRKGKGRHLVLKYEARFSWTMK